MKDFSHINWVHCVGIGGIGISAIARMMLVRGKKVTGSEMSKSKVTDELTKNGAAVFDTHEASHIDQSMDVVVYTTAVPQDNPELVAAREKNIPIYTYPEFLGLISENMRTIAVSGTHGKTTTTAMVAQMLINAGKKPTVIVGSLLKGYESNYIEGNEDLFVVEACEYRRSFLNLKPHILVITNIDTDHLDYYRDLADIQSAFVELAKKMTTSDYLICNTQDPILAPVISATKAKIIDSTTQPRELHLKVPGQHNIENARMALSVGSVLGIDQQLCVQGVEKFDGTWRRFEYKKTTVEGALVYDDYGHHPTEVKTTLQGARDAFPHKKIIVVFQPHLYSRTKLLLEDFAQSFNAVDEVVLTPIYAAREKFDPTISSEILLEKIPKSDSQKCVGKDFLSIAGYLKPRLNADTVVFTMGAGDVYKVADLL